MTIFITTASQSQTLLDAVNRVLRISGIIRGDTDPITSFSDTQHNATLNLAIIAIQSVLTDLAAYYDLPMERKTDTITFVAGTRVYNMAADFMQFWNNQAYVYDAVQNLPIPAFAGGEQKLSRDLPNYQTQNGYPIAFYEVDGAATKQIGFFPVPTASEAGRVITYDYEKDIIPLVETDRMPFVKNIEVYKFCELAAVKFNAIFSQEPRSASPDVEHDPTYISARADLLKLLTQIKPSTKYGRAIRSR